MKMIICNELIFSGLAEEKSEKSNEEGNEEKEGDEEDDEDDDEEEEEEDEEDPIDPFDTARDKCANTKKCQDLYAKFEQCEARVNSKQKTEENCSEEILDFFHCQDFCASKGLFSNLK